MVLPTCAQITLNTSDTETAVCSLGSVSLPHLLDGPLDADKLRSPGPRCMLDNVIGLNYPRNAKASNLRHRPVGLGLMGGPAKVACGIDCSAAGVALLIRAIAASCAGNDGAYGPSWRAQN